jgi:hypothetical protein
MTIRASIIGLFIIAACSKPPTLKQAGAVTDATCEVLRAFEDTPAEEAICATADDILGMMADIRATRADAGPANALGRNRKAGKCHIVGTVCASDEELAMAIQARKAAKP